MSTIPARFENVTVQCKANVYFDGKVVSHTILSGQQKRTHAYETGEQGGDAGKEKEDYNCPPDPTE